MYILRHKRLGVQSLWFSMHRCSDGSKPSENNDMNYSILDDKASAGPQAHEVNGSGAWAVLRLYERLCFSVLTRKQNKTEKRPFYECLHL